MKRICECGRNEMEIKAYERCDICHSEANHRVILVEGIEENGTEQTEA